MLNREPIFVNGFQRGGTNILMNLISSHPRVALLGGETHEVFHGKSKAPMSKVFRRAFYVPLLVAARKDIFRTYDLYDRPALPSYLTRYVDLLFYLHKLKAPGNSQRSTKGKKISKSAIGKKRLLAKNVNGVVLTTSLFAQMYPDATFIGLVRNGLALCESFARRGWKIEDFAIMYERVCQKIIQDAREMPNYTIIRFEDLIADPIDTVRAVYSHVKLNLNDVKEFRLQAKLSMDKDGTRRYKFGGEKNRERCWFSLEEVPDCFRTDVNENQMAQLPEEQKRSFLQHAYKSMEHFGYC